MRDTEKYLYVEIALPREHPAVEQMLAEAERLDISLRTLIKTTCLEAYGDTEFERKPRKPVKKKDSPPSTAGGVEVSAEALNSADDFLDDMGI
jgi:hypothetical protein